ncbi:MAG: hypothetical protein Q4C83_03290 [Candidatus Saccharibacteria bacterium]|nr:hypothetical protein [Candidatus Saccharibacteria bacterium]
MMNNAYSGTYRQSETVSILSSKGQPVVLKEGEWVLVLEADKGRNFGICDNVQFHSDVPAGWAVDLRIKGQDGHGYVVEDAIRVFKERGMWLDGAVYRVRARLHQAGRVKIEGRSCDNSPDGQWRPMNVQFNNGYVQGWRG